MGVPESGSHSVAVALLAQLRRARDHIDRNYREPLDLDRLAAVARVSKYHFARSFEVAYGETPIRYCLDQTETRDFYVNVLGFEPGTDIMMGEGFRWVTMKHPNQPELQVTLMTPGPPLDPEAADFVRRQLDKGGMGGLGLSVDDCHKTFEELSEKGVTFLQEPSDRPCGVEAVMRDNTGNWLVLVEPRDFTPEDFK